VDEFWNDEGRLPDETIQLLISSNFDDLISQPIYMHPDTTQYRAPYLHSDVAIAYDDSVPWPDGAFISGYLLHDNASGSVVDVASFSGYSLPRNRWTILLSRALTAGSDDIDFSTISPGDSVMVTIAIMDNADRLHMGSEPFYIIFP
jgi:hypothetical protein